jgi:hypothetical protein
LFLELFGVPQAAEAALLLLVWPIGDLLELVVGPALVGPLGGALDVGLPSALRCRLLVTTFSASKGSLVTQLLPERKFSLCRMGMGVSADLSTSLRRRVTKNGKADCAIWGGS